MKLLILSRCGKEACLLGQCFYLNQLKHCQNNHRQNWQKRAVMWWMCSLCSTVCSNWSKCFSVWPARSVTWAKKTHSYAAMSLIFIDVYVGVLISHVLSFSFLDQGVDNVGYWRPRWDHGPECQWTPATSDSSPAPLHQSLNSLNSLVKSGTVWRLPNGSACKASFAALKLASDWINIWIDIHGCQLAHSTHGFWS